jgi:hypothetical protein
MPEQPHPNQLLGHRAVVGLGDVLVALRFFALSDVKQTHIAVGS